MTEENKSNFKFKEDNSLFGNGIIAYKCLNALDGYDYLFPHYIQRIITCVCADDQHCLIIFHGSESRPRFKYDTKEECLADRDKLLNWLIGIDSNPSK